MAREPSADSLWSLAAPPGLWAAHFLLCYLTAAIWCAKLAAPSGSLTTVRLLIGGYTALAVVSLAALGLRSWRRARSVAETSAHEDSAAGRRRFFGFLGLLLSLLSAMAVLLAALVAVFIRSCW